MYSGLDQDSSTSASRVLGTTDEHHRVQLAFQTGPDLPQKAVLQSLPPQ
jgi:hypothetical protein